MISLLVQVLAIAYLLATGGIRESSFQSLIGHTLVLYSPPLGIMLGGLFAERAELKDKKDTPTNSYWIAMVSAAVWNFILLLMTVIYLVKGGTPNMLIDYQETISEISTVLISGFLSYFYTRK